MPSEPFENKIGNISSGADRSSIIWGVGLFAVITVILTAAMIYLLGDKNLNYSYGFSSALSLVRQFYPEAHNERKMIDLARDAVISGLDRFSGYMDKGELDRAMEEFGGSYGGVGITVVGHKLGLQVMSVREDGPAGKAGIRTGDIIISAGGEKMEGVNPYRAANYLRGPEGSMVEVKVIRPNELDTLTFGLTRERLKLIHVPYAGITEGKSLYIRILDFEAGVTDEVAGALDSLYFKKKDSIRGIIFDLRGNPGGLLDEAINLSDLFIGKGKLIVGIKGRSRWNQQEFRATNNDVTDGLPMAIIVDRGSASASEIFSGAMKYAGRGVLIGDTTFGKGLVQELDRFFDGSGLRLTTARYYFEGNRFINDPGAPVLDSAAGIPPDYYMAFPEYESFPLSLENSQVMRDFVFSRKDDPALDSGAAMIPSDWFAEFESFARKKGFIYRSELTNEIDFALNEAVFDKDSESTVKAIERLYSISKAQDSLEFNEYREYIMQRLFQIALDAKFGTALSYRKAILPYRQDVVLAEKIFQAAVKN